MIEGKKQTALPGARIWVEVFLPSCWATEKELEQGVMNSANLPKCHPAPVPEHENIG